MYWANIHPVRIFFNVNRNILRLCLFHSPVSEESSGASSIESTIDVRETTGTPPSVELLSKEPQYGELKSHFKKRRSAFLSDEQARADHKAYLKRDDNAEYSALYAAWLFILWSFIYDSALDLALSLGNLSAIKPSVEVCHTEDLIRFSQ